MIKLLKRIGIGVLVLLLLVPLYIVASGNNYMFFMLQHTVLDGRMGPTIDEYTIYPNRAVEVSENPMEWPISNQYESNGLNDEENAFHEKYGSAAYLIIKDGELFYEKYWDSYSDTSRTNSWSMAKSICSHLLGCALKDGYIESLDQNIGDYLNGYSSDSVSIRDLLTMSSGYNFYESYNDPFSYTARTLYGKDLREVHELYKRVDSNGEVYNYKSGNTQLLGFIISEATGMTLSEYASLKLWKPIGAKEDAMWSLDHEGGEERAYCCFNSNARDFAKFGYLYLNHGIVNGDTLISEDYYQEAIRLAPIMLESGEPNNRYGFQWWISSLDGENFFYAQGLNGQYLVVMPESNLIIVRLGASRSPVRIKGHPEDMFEYLRMAKNMVGLSKS